MPGLPEGFSDKPPDPALLNQVQPRESGGKNMLPQENYDYPRSHASGFFQDQPQTWKDWSRASGIGTQYSEAYQAPKDIQIAVNEWGRQKYGLNATQTWAASAPKGGYKALPVGFSAQKPQAQKLPEGFSAQKPAPITGPMQGPPQRPQGMVDPSIAARQNVAPGLPLPNIGPAVGQAAGAEALGMQNAAGAKIAQWLGMKAAHGYDWVSKLSPDLISNAIGTGQDWTANKLQSAAETVFRKIGVDNPETQAHNLTSFVLFDLPLSRVAVAGEAGAIKSPAIKTAEGHVVEGVNHPSIRAAGADGEPGFTTHSGEFVDRKEGAKIAEPAGQKLPNTGPELHSEDMKPGTSQARAPSFASVGAEAVPTHEILAQNIRSREATLAATDPTFKENMRRAGNALKSFTAPETMREVDTGEQLGKEAAANIREKIGLNEREKQISAQALDQYYKMFNGVTPEEGLTVLRWLQKPETRGEGGYEPTPETSSFMNAFRKEMKGMQSVLETLPKTESMNFKQNFVSQMWENPKQTLDRIVGGKSGSNYFTKKSVWDSYEDGIRQGGVPISTNPLELGVRYIENARNLITQYQILDTASDTNRMVWRAPGEQPRGWVEVGGRARNYKGPGQVAYAPPGYAEVYNNYVSTLPQGAKGDILTAIQRTANAATMVNLGLSGFHASLMMQESMASGIANAIDNFTHGKVLTGTAKLGESVVPGVYAATSIWRAREGINEYLNKESGNPKTQKAVRALAAANFRMRGRGAITDEYRASFLPDLVTSLRKGRLKMEAAQATADIMKHPIAGTVRQIASLVLRALDTISAPVFQYAVPRLKTGAALDMMYSYMKRKPDASDMELAAYARQVSNIIDDRFGEMNHDNIFLHKLQKTIMQSLVVSYSYEYGSARAAAGAIGDTANFLKGGWTPQMSYPIGLFASMAIHSAMYQYLMTGKAIGSAQDVHTPQTGGTDPRSGQPGRAILPQQLNQVFNFWNDPRQEMTNKLNVLWKTAWDLWGAMGPTGGYDWKNDPIVDKNAPGIEQLAQAGYFAMSSFAPISLSQQAKPGSAIPGWQRPMGVRDAPRRFVDPQGSAEGLRYVNAEKAVTKKQHDGELPAYLPHYIKKKYIQQELNRYRGPQ